MTTIEFQRIDRQFRQNMAELLRRTSDLSPLMTEIAGHLHAVVERSFEDEASPFGTPWQKLKAKTIKDRKRKSYWSGKILQRTGELAASAVAQSGELYAEVAVGAPYAEYHQFGTSAIPARPFLGLGEFNYEVQRPNR